MLAVGQLVELSLLIPQVRGSNQVIGKILYVTCLLWAGDGSHGLVVMGDNSCSKGPGFKSRRCILDGHLDIFSHLFVEKIVMFV